MPELSQKQQKAHWNRMWSIAHSCFSGLQFIFYSWSWNGQCSLFYYRHYKTVGNWDFVPPASTHNNATLCKNSGKLGFCFPGKHPQRYCSLRKRWESGILLCFQLKIYHLSHEKPIGQGSPNIGFLIIKLRLFDKFIKKTEINLPQINFSEARAPQSPAAI